MKFKRILVLMLVGLIFIANSDIKSVHTASDELQPGVIFKNNDIK